MENPLLDYPLLCPELDLCDLLVSVHQPHGPAECLCAGCHYYGDLDIWRSLDSNFGDESWQMRVVIMYYCLLIHRFFYPVRYNCTERSFQHITMSLGIHLYLRSFKQETEKPRHLP